MSINQLTGIEYLEKNLLPLVKNIQPTVTKSYILQAVGLDNRPSLSSINIQFGNKIEIFWNKVISDSNAKNLIEENNLIIINKNKKQQDHFFCVEDKYFYLESKCNLNLDSEKSKASNQKIKDITNKHKVKIDNLISGYFVPVKSIISTSERKKYSKKGIDVFGVNWLYQKIEIPFTEEEYFNFLKDVIGPLLVKKGL
jgi:hypothetical protein